MARSKREPKFQDMFRVEAKLQEIEDDVQKIMEGVHRSRRSRGGGGALERGAPYGAATLRGTKLAAGRRVRRREGAVTGRRTIPAQAMELERMGPPESEAIRHLSENSAVLISRCKRKPVEAGSKEVPPTRKAARATGHNLGNNMEVGTFPPGPELRVSGTAVLQEAQQQGQNHLLASPNQAAVALKNEGPPVDCSWTYT